MRGFFIIMVCLGWMREGWQRKSFCAVYESRRLQRTARRRTKAFVQLPHKRRHALIIEMLTIGEFNPDRSMVARLFPAADMPIDSGIKQPAFYLWTQQEMINA
jgi:hypothetical protein